MRFWSLKIYYKHILEGQMDIEQYEVDELEDLSRAALEEKARDIMTYKDAIIVRIEYIELKESIVVSYKGV